jgi:hypothetical protein
MLTATTGSNKTADVAQFRTSKRPQYQHQTFIYSILHMQTAEEVVTKQIIPLYNLVPIRLKNTYVSNNK